MSLGTFHESKAIKRYMNFLTKIHDQPYCEGVRLNASHFKQILDALRKEAAAKSVSDYVKTSLKEAAEIFTNPKRVISEWKDLKAVLRMLRYRVFTENPKLRSMLVGIQKSLPL